METKVISITKPIIEGEELTAEQLIVYTARVSNPSNQSNHETADRLLAYLIKHKHWSPFDMVHFCVEVKTSRAIAQQILRHWSMDFQEFSQRYAEVVDLEEVQIRKQGAITRQGGEEVFDPKVLLYADSDCPRQLASEAIQEHLKHSQQLYKSLIEAGVAKECARMIVPLTTQTTLYMNGSVRSWIHYLQQRLDPHAQLEHREVAQQIEELFKGYFPNVHKAVFEHGEG